MEFDPSLSYECEQFPAEGMSPTKWGSPDLYRNHFRIRSKGGSFTFTVK
jgi:hypothetical protein